MSPFMTRHDWGYDALSASVIRDGSEPRYTNNGVGKPLLAPDAPSLSDEIRAILNQVGVHGKRATLTKGSTVSLYGGPRAGLHFVLHGRMKLIWLSEKGQGLILDLLDVGEVFGEMFLVEELEPSFAEALEPAVIETVPRFSVEQAWRERPALAIALTRVLADRRNRVERRLGAQVLSRVPTRLALLLLDLAEHFGKVIPPLDTSSVGGVRAQPRMLDITISQRDLGSLIGASREFVRIARGSVPVEAAVLIAKQIAEALEAGHEAGVVHRDGRGCAGGSGGHH